MSSNVEIGRTEVKLAIAESATKSDILLRAKGLPRVVVKEGRLLKIFADGRTEVLLNEVKSHKVVQSEIQL